MSAGNYNVFLGDSAGYNTNNGSKNVFIGSNAGYYETGSNKLYIDNSRTSSPLIWGDFTNGSEKLIINGSVGVGITPGSYKLYVAGNAYTTGTWGGSDLRWKKNITPLSGSIKKIQQIHAVTYEWRKEEFPEMNFDNSIQVGLIAQELEKVFPELVKTDDKGYKAVAYDKLTVILLEGMKEQQKEIELLKAELEQIRLLIQSK